MLTLFDEMYLNTSSIMEQGRRGTIIMVSILVPAARRGTSNEVNILMPGLIKKEKLYIKGAPL